MSITARSRWSLGRGKPLVPSAWQATVLAGEYADEATIKDIRQQYGLDQPMWSQFTAYATKVVRGDLARASSTADP